MRLVPARSHDPERMDRDDNPEPELAAALGDVRLVNRFLGGRRALCRALAPWLGRADPARDFEVLDVGTGSADLPRAIAERAARTRRRVRIVAVDRDPATAAIAAREVRGLPAVRVVRADARRLPFAPRSFDVVTASMFLHHFEHADAVELVRGFLGLARRAVVINDLRRHRAAWAAIFLLARATHRHAMFVHDAPLSVLRGFTAAELLEIAREAGADAPAVRSSWPYRLVLTVPVGAAA